MDEYQMEFATGFGESYLNCPACGKEMVSGHSECFSCGVVLSRYENRKNLIETKANIGGVEHLTSNDLKRLDRKWKQVVVNYHDQHSHQEFLDLCRSHGAMPFAIHHYSKMLEIDKEDDIAQLMRKQAFGFLTVNFETVKSQKTVPVSSNLDKILKWVNWLGLFFSSACVMTGIMMPDARNLVGLGVASLTLFIALYLFRRR